jgi:hypothetical protein
MDARPRRVRSGGSHGGRLRSGPGNTGLASRFILLLSVFSSIEGSRRYSLNGL